MDKPLTQEEWRLGYTETPQMIWNYYGFKDKRRRPFILVPGQAEYAKAIFRRERRIIIRGPTRYGKTKVVGQCLGIMAATNFEDIRILAPSLRATDLIMGATREAILSSPELYRGLEFPKGRIHKAQQKLQARSMKFFDPGSEIQAITANIQMKGLSSMGEGGTIIVIDECENIPRDILRSKVYRMLGDDPERSMMILLSNPVKRGFMYDMWKDPESGFVDLWVDDVQALREGRLKRGFIRDVKRKMTEGEYMVYYRSMWSEDVMKQLIREAWIQAAVTGWKALRESGYLADEIRAGRFVITVKRIGLDVATKGADKAVIITAVQFEDPEGNIKYFLDYPIEIPVTDTMKLAGTIIGLDNRHNYDTIGIDGTGNGEGVVDACKLELDIRGKVDGIISAEAAPGLSPFRKENKLIYVNRKALDWRNIAKLFEDGDVYIPPHAGLIDDLRSIQYEYRDKDGRMIIIDPDSEKNLEDLPTSKSPDYADALRYCLSAKVPPKFRASGQDKF